MDIGLLWVALPLDLDTYPVTRTVFWPSLMDMVVKIVKYHQSVDTRVECRLHITT